jgi:hypothetical protein
MFSLFQPRVDVSAQPSVKELFANAFIELPFPKKITGMRSAIERKGYFFG